METRRTINSASVNGEPGTGFEERGDLGEEECGNCKYFRNGNACFQKDMLAKSKRKRHPNGDVVVGSGDCCAYVHRKGKKKTGWRG